MSHFHPVPLIGYAKRECASESTGQPCLDMKVAGFLSGILACRECLEEPHRTMAEKLALASQVPGVWNRLIQGLSASCGWLHYEAIYASPIRKGPIMNELSRLLEGEE
jgi:hypothetical protein